MLSGKLTANQGEEKMRKILQLFLIILMICLAGGAMAQTFYTANQKLVEIETSCKAIIQTYNHAIVNNDMTLSP